MDSLLYSSMFSTSICNCIHDRVAAGSEVCSISVFMLNNCSATSPLSSVINDSEMHRWR